MAKIMEQAMGLKEKLLEEPAEHAVSPMIKSMTALNIMKPPGLATGALRPNSARDPTGRS